ncbi:hypothetical protein HMPREF1545_02765 [Oscillibacter sp. KLE 1728]|nr:hypothetical protein HMPREF1545_02765 [Oscillibacter sp. KLE 1728]
MQGHSAERPPEMAENQSSISKKLGQHNPLLQQSAHFRCLET